jgi:hypothetical protein
VLGVHEGAGAIPVVQTEKTVCGARTFEGLASTRSVLRFTSCSDRATAMVSIRSTVSPRDAGTIRSLQGLESPRWHHAAASDARREHPAAVPRARGCGDCITRDGRLSLAVVPSRTAARLLGVAQQQSSWPTTTRSLVQLQPPRPIEIAGRSSAAEHVGDSHAVAGAIPAVQTNRDRPSSRTSKMPGQPRLAVHHAPVPRKGHDSAKIVG